MKNEAERGGARLLDEVCALCGYERKYAIKVLGGKRPIGGSGKRRRGGSPARYGAPEREVIKSIWLRAEQPCGKRRKRRWGCGCRIMKSVMVLCLQRFARVLAIAPSRSRALPGRELRRGRLQSAREGACAPQTLRGQFQFLARDAA